MPRFVVSAIDGGLGNQLFQRFAGLYVARRLGAVDLLDIGFYARQHMRSYRLGEYAIPQRFASPLHRVLARLSISTKARPLWRRVGARYPDFQVTLVREESSSLDEALQASTSVWLRGYWQDYRFLEGMRETIEDELRLRVPLTGAAADWERKLRGTRSVCVHVRRGDYASDRVMACIFSLCGPDYFRAAMDLISEQFPDAQFYIFSDDPPWAAEHVGSLRRCTMVDYARSGRGDVEDFELMRACTHFIISNSTFSWWPAWLSRVPEKRVIAPERWFLDGRSLHLIPPGWVTLP